MNCLSHCISGSRKSSNTKIMANFFRRRALYTNAKQAKYTFVSLSGDLEERQTRGGEGNMSLLFTRLGAGGFLYRCGIRDGDRLISVNFFPAKDLPFDLLIETIRGLTPLVLGVERTVKDDQVVTIVVVMEIRADKNDEPQLRFHGLYLFKDTEVLDVDTIIKFIPIEVEPLITYRYNSTVPNTKFIGLQDNDRFWLTVDGSNIEFRRADSSKASFTMYTYNSNQVPQHGTPVILVPDDNPTQCLSATPSNQLILEYFDETVATGSGPLPVNGRFLLLVENNPNQYTIESSMVEGQCITKGPDNEAEMSDKGIIFEVHEGGD